MLNKVVDYRIISGVKALALEDKVKEAIKDGWAPSGPVFEYDDLIHQAMVKFGE